MKLDYRQTEAFLMVVENGSFELAATRLHLTPSALSQRVRALEAMLGKPLLVRTRPCHATRDGQRLLQHLRRVALLESDLEGEFSDAEAGFLTLPVAINADSVASWFLPAVASFLIDKQILLDVTVDDQDHTNTLLKTGMVLGSISTEEQPMRGCEAQSLGLMRYRCMASPAYRARWFADGITRETIRSAPVLVFNRKDRLQADFILQHFGLADDAYPCHFLPASEGFLNAARLGLGWGMLPEVMLAQWCQPGELVDLFPEQPVDVPLYWHAWKVQPPRLAQLSKVLVAAARQVLR